MIEYIKGDMFLSNLQTFVNPVNIVGVMGTGLARKFAKFYPDMYIGYKEMCDTNEIEIGKLYLYKANNLEWILNFPTKKDWKKPSRLEYIESGLISFVNVYNVLGITGAAFPQLGCGKGGLHWQDVKHLMENYLNDLDIPIEVYLYDE